MPGFSYRTTTMSLLAAVTAAVAIPLAPAVAETSAIGSLVGSWAGSGRVSYTDGSSESIRCTAYYTGGGASLRMAIQCNSDKNPIHIRSQLTVSGGRASGEWEERTFNASGTASGRVGSGSLSLAISGGGFSGAMAVSIGRSAHSVNITAQGVALSRVTINFSRK